MLPERQASAPDLDERLLALEDEIQEPTLVEKALRAALAEAHGAEDTLRQVQAVTAALCEAASPQDVANTIVTTACDALAASGAVAYLMTDDGHLELAAHRGLYGSVERLKRLPLDAPLPLAEALRKGQPVFYGDWQSLVVAYPNLAHSETPPEALQSVAALPLVAQGRILGGVAFSFPKSWKFEAAHQAMLTTMVQQGSQALLRAKLYETERRTREERDGLVHELTETVRLNEIFAGVLAHDLRNPLAAIVTAARVALSFEHDERVSKSLGVVLTSGGRMARMIEQLLDFTRLRVGTGLELALERVDLSELCREVVTEIERTSTTSALRIEHAGDTMGVWDADRLMQVFSNLAGNAVEHGEPGGSVEIHLDGNDPEVVVAAIRNRGAIPEELLPVLFDPFRGAQRRSTGKRGFGLGLFISKEFVIAHRGTIEVSSADGQTAFVVRLPRSGQRAR
ncbi:MAG: GAF domain-containing sensor histidine kinase [Polyangiaceae bacterium]|nr:GAF domain-containing sensor histidine kinase [Polyangiaceae bacterium]